MAQRTSSGTRAVGTRTTGTRTAAKGRVVDTKFWENVAACWHFDEASGNAVDRVAGLTLTANAAPGSVAGAVGNARSFVRSSAQYFSKTDEATMSMGDISFAFSFWFQHQTQTGAAGDYGLINKYTSASQRSYKLYVPVGTNLATVQMSADGLSSSGVFHQVVGPAPVNDVWTHYVFGYDKDSLLIRLYVNNVPYSGDHSGGAFDGTVAFEVGRGGGAGLTADGYVDALVCWKNYFPAPPEVALLYNGGVPWQMPR